MNERENHFLKVENNNSFLREKVSSAIVNINDEERLKYLARRKALLNKEERIDKLENRIFELEYQIKILTERLKNVI